MSKELTQVPHPPSPPSLARSARRAAFPKPPPEGAPDPSEPRPSEGCPRSIPETMDLWPGKIFLMSFNLFHECLQSTKPRTLNASALGDEASERLPGEVGAGGRWHVKNHPML